MMSQSVFLPTDIVPQVFRLDILETEMRSRHWSSLGSIPHQDMRNRVVLLSHLPHIRHR